MLRQFLILTAFALLSPTVFPSAAAFAQSAGNDFQIRIKPLDSPVSRSQQQALSQFLADVKSALPQKLKDAFKKPIQIEFKNLGDAGFGPPPCASQANSPNYRYGLEPVIMPWQSEHAVEMNEGFLSEIYKGPHASTAYACGHKTLYRLAVATAIHEIAHHYDALNIDATPEAVARRKNCDLVLMERDSSSPDDVKQCEAYTRSGTSVSGRPDFLALMGFLDTPDHQNRRSPDPYEFKNEKESFAVNMEFFTLDPNFACRRPSVYKFLAHQFGITTQPTCTRNMQVVITSYDPKNWRVVNFDPSRVYAIHYFLADDGTEIMSKFGHSMFRVVYCSPQRAVVGPDCLKDVEWHFVVSYRANIRGIEINQVDGLTGQYPSEMFLLRFLDVINEYTMGESRRVISYPLSLNRAQVEAVVSKIQEDYWQYENRYFFLNNNCATESLNLLRAALPEHTMNTDGRAITPKGLRKLLFQEQLLDENAPSSTGAIGRYIFPSLFEGATESYNQVKAFGFPESANTLDKFLELTAAQRGALYQQMDQANLTHIKELNAHFLELELLCRTRAEQVAEKNGAKLMQESDFTGILKLQDSLLPWNLAQGGYGIPLASEMPAIDQLNSLLTELNRLTQQNLDLLRAKLVTEKAEYDQCSQNIKTLIAGYRK